MLVNRKSRTHKNEAIGIYRFFMDERLTCYICWQLFEECENLDR